MENKLVIIAPDSFKGTLSASQVCEAIEKGIKSADNNIKTVKIPVADGGEGTVSALCGDNIVRMTVSGPFGECVDSFYGISPNGTAVIEMAAAAGLPLAEGKLNPMTASTFGVGELILHAVKSGIHKIAVGLGGSCTNDAGCGIASALGVRFTDSDGVEFVPVGGTLSRVEHIDTTAAEKLLSGVQIDIMCDIDNPLYGEHGAAYVFAPQKGADDRAVKILDAGLVHISEIIKRELGFDVSEMSGGGAAGGCGAGLAAFLKGRVRSGIEVVLDASGFDGYLRNAELVITGEGHFDSQSINGKVADGIASRLKNSEIPLVVLAGGDAEVSNAYSKGITAVFSIQHEPVAFSEAKEHSYEYLRRTAENVIRLFFSAKKQN